MEFHIKGPSKGGTPCGVKKGVSWKWVPKCWLLKGVPKGIH